MEENFLEDIIDHAHNTDGEFDNFTSSDWIKILQWENHLRRSYDTIFQPEAELNIPMASGIK
jgi:hypothetical protein